MTERVLQMIDKAPIKDYALEKELGFAQGTIGNWRRNKNKVSAEAIIKLARYFNVSADYLLCLSDEPTPLKTTDIAERPNYALSIEFAGLTKDERFVDSAKLYKELPDEKRENVLAYIIGLCAGLGINVEYVLRK